MRKPKSKKKRPLSSLESLVLLPQETLILIVASALDVVMTYKLLTRGDGGFTESNPIAQYFLGLSAHIAAMSGPLGSSELVTVDALLMAALAIIRIVRGSLPDYSKAVFVACGASLLAFILNDYTLKIIFGRYNPHVFFTIQPDRLFNFMHGNQTSAFPSGHMVMATAFAAVLVRAYFRTWPLFAGLLGLAAILLVLGDWHFLSDVIAGIFVGGTVGLMAGELWCEHVQHYTLRL